MACGYFCNSLYISLSWNGKYDSIQCCCTWRYNTAVQRARELERQGLVCIIAPDSTEGMSTLTKNRAGLEKMYAKGKQDAEALVRWMQNTKQDESVGT